MAASSTKEQVGMAADSHQQTRERRNRFSTDGRRIQPLKFSINSTSDTIAGVEWWRCGHEAAGITSHTKDPLQTSRQVNNLCTECSLVREAFGRGYPYYMKGIARACPNTNSGGRPFFAWVPYLSTTPCHDIWDKPK